MRAIGSLVAGVAYGENISPRAIELVDGDRDRFAETCRLCESPIEQIMLARLCNMVVEWVGRHPVVHDLQSGGEFPNHPVVIVPQFPIARFRLDFMVVVVKDRRAWQFAIECDGEKHHNSLTKRRQDHDRDTYLARLGIRTFRYWGTMIYRGEARPDLDIPEHILAVEQARDAA